MTEKNFDALPEADIDIQGKPKPATEFLGEYCKTLGNGTLELIGIKTGFAKLDKATLGLDGLIVLGGIAGAGKTSFALHLALEACDFGTPTLFYSLEMPRRAILTKILNRLAKVKYSDILLKGGQYLGGREAGQYGLSQDQQTQLEAGKKVLEDIGKKFYIRSRERGEGEIDFDTVEQEINFLKAEHKSERVFVVIDHLQVFNAGDYKDQIDKEGKLITGFKGISERTGATILLISQKNKAGWQGSGMQTIKGSVDIVYLADIVMFLESESEKPKKGEKRKSGEQGEQEIDLTDRISITAHFGGGGATAIDLIIDKNRYNAPTTIKLQFNGEYSEFSEAQ